MMYGNENNRKIAPPHDGNPRGRGIDRDDTLDELSRGSDSSMSMPDVFDTGIYEEYAPNLSARTEERQNEGRRYREQHEQFNAVDQTVNLHQPGTYVDQAKVATVIQRITGLARGSNPLPSTGLARGSNPPPSTGLVRGSNAPLTADSAQDSFSLFSRIAGLDMDDVFLDEMSSGATKQNSDSQKQRRNSKLLHANKIVDFCYFFGLFTLLFMSIFLVLFFAIPAFNGVRKGFSDFAASLHDSSASTTTKAPTSAVFESPRINMVHLRPPQEGIRIEVIKQRIIEAGLTNSRDLKNLQSIPFYALRWLSDTDEALLSPGDDHLLERYALAVLYYSSRPDIAKAHSNGKWWLFNSKKNRFANWMTGAGVCEWQGVLCVDRKVMELNLTNQQMEGTIPSELKGLFNLLLLDLSSNKLGGSIPNFRGSDHLGMADLRHLLLGNNLLTGKIPSSLLEYPSLMNLNLNDNALTGKIPRNLEKWSRLETLDLKRNYLSGSIPGSVDKLKAVQTLELQQNRFTGVLPSIVEMTNLEVLKLSSNSFRGTLPSDWPDQHRLRELVVSHNQITGTIPTTYGTFFYLQQLGLNSNEIRGTIPTEFSHMFFLQYLLLDSNQFTGSIPAELGGMERLESFTAQNNQFHTTVGDNICELKEKSLQYIATDCATGDVTCDCCDICY